MKKENYIFGRKAENVVAKWYKGKKVGYTTKEYDIETTNYLIEVKSCQFVIINGATKTPQFGRFKIVTDNHIGLYLKSLQLNKIPIYVFLAYIGNRIMIKQMKYEDIIVYNNKEFHHLPVGKIFSNYKEKNKIILR